MPPEKIKRPVSKRNHKREAGDQLAVANRGNRNVIAVGRNALAKVLNIYIFKDLRQLALFLAAFVVLVGAIGAGVWVSKRPSKMTGNFNIAVAQFLELQPDGSYKPSATAEKIGSNLFDYLDSEYRASGLTVQVAHDKMPPVRGEADAERLTDQVNADIVIFGTVSVQGAQAEFSPRFYVAEQPDTQEMTGQSELAYPIQFNLSDLGSEDEILAQLRSRTTILLDFTKGLIYLSKGDFDRAENSNADAIAQAQKLSAPFEGQEVLYLLAARIQMSQGHDEQAFQFLDQALALNPNYARAYLARGNIFYTQAVKANFQTDLLDQALNEFTRAFEAPNQPEGANIPIKAHTSLGNVLVIKAQQTNEAGLFSQAVEHYNYVTGEYRDTKDPFLRGFASVAYFGLGAAYERQGRTAEAVENYGCAYVLTDDQEFRSRIQGQIKAAQGNVGSQDLTCKEVP